VRSIVDKQAGKQSKRDDYIADELPNIYVKK
jgi:hypothetical protein